MKGMVCEHITPALDRETEGRLRVLAESLVEDVDVVAAILLHSALMAADI